ALSVSDRDRRVQRDLALDLVGIEVGGRCPVIDTADAGRGSRGEENGFDERGLADAAVSDEADVADLGNVQRHACLPLVSLNGWTRASKKTDDVARNAITPLSKVPEHGGRASRWSRAIPRAADGWLERGGETRCRDLRRGPDDLVAEDAEALDLGFHAVPCLEEVARRGSHTVGSPGRDDVARQETQALGQHLDALRDGEHHLGRVALLANLTVDAE